tara:strand:+ start:47 stop:406 length:360 start_codon:yes stop_codon:yes gene_type:complete
MYTGQRYLGGQRTDEDAVLYQHYDNKKWQQDWEELTGSNSMAPIRMMLSGSGGKFQTNDMAFLQEQALEYRRKQQALSRQKFQESLDEEQWRNDYMANRTKQQPGRSNASPSMQNPFQF